MYQKIASLLVALSCVSSFTAVAQSSGELENVEIEIVKERKISLPEAERKFTKIAPQASEPISPPITYSFRPIEVQLPLANLTVRPLKLKQETIEEGHRGQLSAGYGNFASPYLEGYITSKSNAKRLLGAHAIMDIWAKGPVDKRNSGNGKYGISVFANSFNNQVKTGAYASFDQTFWHFYGYPEGTSAEAEDVLQNFDRFLVGGNIANASKGKVEYDLNGSFAYIADRFHAKESKIDLRSDAVYQIDDTKKLKVDASFLLLSRKDELMEAKPRNLLRVGGRYVFSPVENLLVEAGFGIVYENDTVDKDFHVYPKLLAAYELNKTVRAKVSLSGDMNAVSLHSLSQENPWLAPNVNINHTNEVFALGVGLEAKLSSAIRSELGGSVSSLKNLYFYSNKAADPSMFELLYDKGNTERVNFYGQLEYAIAQRTSAGFRGDWFSYNTDVLAEAWHRPTYKLTFDVSHNFYKKLKVSSSLITLGGMRAYDVDDLRAVTLKTAVDLSLRADYFVSETFLVFLQGANLLSSDYNIYLNYPVRGIQVRAGISWAF